MLIHKSFSDNCDICDAPGPHEQGAAALAQGATGRWCEVIWMCHECADGNEILEPEEAAARILHTLGGTIDFEHDESVVADGLFVSLKSEEDYL